MASGSSLSSFRGARPKKTKLNKKNPVPLPKLPNDKNKSFGSIRIVGYLRKDCVYINNVKSIDFLYEKGFFGKVPPPEFDPLIPKKDRPQKEVEKFVEDNYLLADGMRKMEEMGYSFTISDSTPTSSTVPTPENDPLPTQREGQVGKDLEKNYLLEGSRRKMEQKGCSSTSSDSTPRSSKVPTPENEPLLTQRERQIGKDLEDEEYLLLSRSLHKMDIKGCPSTSSDSTPRSSHVPIPENDPLPTQIDKDFKKGCSSTSSDSTPRSSKVPTPENEPLLTQRERQIGKDLEDEEYLLLSRSLHKMDIKGCPSTNSDSTPRSSQVPIPEYDPLPTQIDKDFKKGCPSTSSDSTPRSSQVLTPENDPLLTQGERQIGKDLEDEEYLKLGHSLHQMDIKECPSTSSDSMPRSSQVPTAENDSLLTHGERQIGKDLEKKNYLLEGWRRKMEQMRLFSSTSSDSTPSSSQVPSPENDPLPTKRLLSSTSSDSTPSSSQVPSPENDPLFTPRERRVGLEYRVNKNHPSRGRWVYNLTKKECPSTSSDSMPRSSQVPTAENDSLLTHGERQIGKDLEKKNYLLEGWRRKMEQMRLFSSTSSDSTPSSSQVPSPENDPLPTKRLLSSTSSDSTPSSSQVPSPENDPLFTPRERRVGLEYRVNKNHPSRGRWVYNLTKANRDRQAGKIMENKDQPMAGLGFDKKAKEAYSSIIKRSDKSTAPIDLLSDLKLSDPEFDNEDRASDVTESDSTSNVTGSDSTSNVTGSDSTSNVTGSDSTSNVAGSDSTSNVAGSDSTSNVAGSDSTSNVAGSDSTSNVAGSDSTSYVAGSDSTSYITGSDSTSYIMGSDLSSTESEDELEITFEEAFFLSFGLSCLDVKNNGKSMTLVQMWEMYSELAVDRTFSISYAAFHHFRSKNWLVKCDHKVDIDYVLYRSGPPYRNPSYAVIVMDGEMGKEVRKEWVLSRYHIAELYREHKRRGVRLLFCCVIKEASVKNETPKLHSSYRMKEVLVKDLFGAKAYKPYKPYKPKKSKKNP